MQNLLLVLAEIFLLFKNFEIVFIIFLRQKIRKMKPIPKNFLFFCLSFLSFTFAYKISMQNKLHSTEKNVMLNNGDRIDGRYRLVEKTNELTCPKMNEEW